MFCYNVNGGPAWRLVGDQRRRPPAPSSLVPGEEILARRALFFFAIPPPVSLRATRRRLQEAGDDVFALGWGVRTSLSVTALF